MRTQVYVSNLSNFTREEDLDLLFRNFTKVVLSKLINFRGTHHPSGSAFVSLDSFLEACNSVKILDGAKLLGNAIEVILAKTRRKISNISVKYWS